MPNPSARCLLSGVERTWLIRTQTSHIDPLRTSQESGSDLLGFTPPEVLVEEASDFVVILLGLRSGNVCHILRV